jgi:hypothetical protein
MEKVKLKTTGQLERIEVTPEMEGPMQELKSNISSVGPDPSAIKGVPPLNLPGLPELPAGEIPLNADQLTSRLDVPEIETPIGNMNEIQDQISGVSDDVKSITDGNLKDVQELPKTLEEQAGKIEGVQHLQEQSAVIDEYKSDLTGLNDPDAIKAQAEEMIAKEAVNHFAGKEDLLKSAMASMSKFKQKYSSVTSLFELPKRVPNAMKGVPFIERLVPGLYLQYQKKNLHLGDINPYLSYKASGRLTPGLGWNQRYAYDEKHELWPRYARIYGPRIFLDAKMSKGFIAHLEQEAMSTFVPSRSIVSGDYGKREWVWSTFIGLKKQYTIYKRFKGTVLIQYNLVNRYFKTPYVDRLNSRMGFEYNLKKRVKTNTD